MSIGNLSSVRSDLQHIVHRRINILDVVRALLELLHKVLLELSRLANNHVDLAALHRRNLESGNLGQHVCKVAEKELQLAHILKARKALLHAVALSARLDLDAVDHFAKLLCPSVEGGESKLIQEIGLQVFLHDIHFGHRVHYRRCGSKYDTTAAVQLLQVTNLRVKVKRALRAVLVAEARYVRHRRGVE